MAQPIAATTGLSPRLAEVIEAALDCFNDRGVEACPIGLVCERAGASVGSIYHHFGSKEGLAGAVFCEGIARFQWGYLEALQGAASATQGISALVNYHLQWVQEQPRWARFLLRTRAHALEAAARLRLEGMNVQFHAAMANWFAHQVRSGAIARLPSGLYVALLVGPCQEWARAYLEGYAPAADDALREAMAQAICRALGVQAAHAAGDLP